LTCCFNNVAMFLQGTTTMILVTWKQIRYVQLLHSTCTTNIVSHLCTLKPIGQPIVLEAQWIHNIKSTICLHQCGFLPSLEVTSEFSWARSSLFDFALESTLRLNIKNTEDPSFFVHCMRFSINHPRWEMAA